MKNFKQLLNAMPDDMADCITGVQYDGDPDTVAINFDLILDDGQWGTSAKLTFVDGKLTGVDDMSQYSPDDTFIHHSLAGDAIPFIVKVSQIVYKWWTDEDMDLNILKNVDVVVY